MTYRCPIDWLRSTFRGGLARVDSLAHTYGGLFDREGILYTAHARPATKTAVDTAAASAESLRTLGCFTRRVVNRPETRVGIGAGLAVSATSSLLTMEIGAAFAAAPLLATGIVLGGLAVVGIAGYIVYQLVIE